MTRSTALKGRKKKVSGYNGSQELFNQCVAADILDTNEEITTLKNRVTWLAVALIAYGVASLAVVWRINGG
jgi:hypothetical protein